MASKGKSKTEKRPKAVKATAPKSAFDDAGVYGSVCTPEFVKVERRAGSPP